MMRTGWTGDWENPLLGQALLSACEMIGTRSAHHIRASGHVRRANRGRTHDLRPTAS
jgi:hypothetical protein